MKLFFGNPQGSPTTSDRVFDVLIDGQPVIENLRIAAGETTIHEVPWYDLRGSLRIRLVAKEGTPVLSGIELQPLL